MYGYRGELVRSERELNLTLKGRLAATRLGRAALKDTLRGALFSSISDMAGTFFPLGIGAAFHAFSWLTIAVAIATLGVLGVAAFRVANGNYVLWSVGLIAMGIALTIAGVELQVT